MFGKVTCECGKQYSWKPELAGKRAKCKCGAVVAFPATDPAEQEAPEGFDDFKLAGDDVPPPPPPPPVGAGANVPPPPPAYANLPRGSMPKSDAKGGFSWKALLNIVIGVAIGGFGVWLFTDIMAKEQANKRVTFGSGRKTGLLRLIYSLTGKWGVLALFLLVALMFVAGGIFTMKGKSSGGSSEGE